MTPLDGAALAALADGLKGLGIEAVAIFFMNSYANPAHEEAAAQALRALLPDAYVTCSTELTREWYEYERTSTVAANAYVGPQVTRYIRRLETDLQAQGFAGSLFMMGSNGGLLSVERSCAQPVALVESGPIGGCIGAGAYAEALGFRNVIAFDMGGTTAKCALVENGRFSVDFGLLRRRLREGLPDQIARSSTSWRSAPAAARSPGSIRRTGCMSARTAPAPCRGRPATATAAASRPSPTPTCCSAASIPTAFSAASSSCRPRPPARRSSGSPGRSALAGSDGSVRMADGILSLATVIMAGAIKQISIEHGLDPREFVLFCYGGGGPLHASALARELSIPTVVVPPEPGNFSAVGMLLADARLDLSKTFVGVLDQSTVAALTDAFAEMEAQARAALVRDFDAREVLFERHAEMRYAGQRHNIKVPISGLADPAGIRQAFDRDYKRRYGHADSKAAAELQALHLSAFTRLRRPELARLPRAATGMRPPQRRPVYFGTAGGNIGGADLTTAPRSRRDSRRPGRP